MTNKKESIWLKNISLDTIVTANFKTDNGREERIEMKLEDMFDFDEIYKKLENKLEDDMYTNNDTFDFDDFDMVGLGLI